MSLKLYSSTIGGGGSVSFPILINQGGTGQTTATLGFNALSPQTTKGDLIAFDGTNSVRFAQGTSGQILSYDPTTSTGLRAIDPPSTLALPVSIANGGTGTTTAILAFNALSPMTTLGDIPYYNGSSAVRKASFSEVDDGNSGTSKTIDFSGYQLSHKLTLTGSPTLTFTAPDQVGSPLTLRVLTGAGSFTITWPGTVKWTGGVAPVVTATASKVDLFVFYWDGTSYYGSYNQNY